MSGLFGNFGAVSALLGGVFHALADGGDILAHTLNGIAGGNQRQQGKQGQGGDVFCA